LFSRLQGRGEIIGATWPEIDIEKAVWIISAHRMKAGREHRVPLSDRAIDVLKAAGPKADGFVFQTQGGDGLSNAAMTAFLKRMEYGHITAHGFRSSFRDWVAESTDHTNSPHT
jgi:integrase